MDGTVRKIYKVGDKIEPGTVLCDFVVCKHGEVLAGRCMWCGVDVSQIDQSIFSEIIDPNAPGVMVMTKEVCLLMVGVCRL